MKPTTLAFVLVLLVVLAGCSSKTPRQPASEDRSSLTENEFILPPNNQDVTTAVVSLRPLPEYLELPTRIVPDPTRVVRVYSPVAGRLVALKVTSGQWVHKGETMAIIESGDVSADLTAYAKAESDLQLKREELDRASDLYQHKAIALKELQAAQANFKTAQADLENVRRQLELLGVSPHSSSDEVRVVAPRSGVVLEVNAAAGEYSKSLDSSQPLCVLADLSTVWAMGDLLEKDLPLVKPGEPADVTLVAYPGKILRGRVSLISSTVDPTTRTLQLRVVLKNEGWILRPNMFGTLKLLRSTHMGIAIPSTAVVREGNSNFVYVQQSPGHFAPQAVTLGGAVGDNQVEILSGLKPSETIVTQGAILLRTATP
ncbi:MAG TPA: efflux RND transporter periplasmic adaptor subunit [Terriglobia bacterium]|nr:efflux RND transporter periplasmic adaptor subunit [Terriglobia bacterium]